MYIYLPIAELPLSIFVLLGLGGLGGLLAGMFGIGGGFLITPLLMFIGVPPPVAVATSANQIIASSTSGFLAHLHRNNVDIKMGLFLLIGGLIGASVGVRLFALLQTIGQIDLVISITYVIFLGFIGSLMVIESSSTILRQRKLSRQAVSGVSGSIPSTVTKKKNWAVRLRESNLPFKVYFPRSDMKVSAMLPIIVGIMAGMLVSLMGIGGGFIMIPAMIYLLGMPTGVVVGTSLFQIVFTTSMVTLLHALTTNSIDIVLALILIMGAVIGAQIGTRIGAKLPAEKLRILLAIIVLSVCFKLGSNLFLEPDNLFSVTEMEQVK